MDLFDFSLKLPITDPTWIFLLVLLIILFAPILLNRLRIPHIIGMILAGLVIGEHGFNILARDSSFELFGKVGLSIKQLQEKKVEEQNTRPAQSSNYRPAPRKQFNNDFRKHNNSGASFEDKLSKFLKDSDEKLTDLRRKTDSKRGGRGGGSRKYE